MAISAESDISNLDAWFTPDAAGDFSYSSGVIISQWNDHSGNGHHMTGISGGTMPSRTGTSPTGLAVVTFVSGDNAPGVASWTPPTQPFTLFCVAKVTSSTWGGVIGGGGGPQGIRRQGDNTIGFDFGSAASYTMDNTNFHVIIGVFNGASSKQYIDGTLVGSSNTGSTNPFVYSLGRDNDGNECSALFGANGIYGKALSGTEATDLSSFLDAKWITGGGGPTGPVGKQLIRPRALIRSSGW